MVEECVPFERHTAKKIRFSACVEENSRALDAKDSTLGKDCLIVCTTHGRNRSPPAPDEAKFTARIHSGKMARNSRKNSTVVR